MTVESMEWWRPAALPDVVAPEVRAACAGLAQELGAAGGMVVTASVAPAGAAAPGEWSLSVNVRHPRAAALVELAAVLLEQAAELLPDEGRDWEDVQEALRLLPTAARREEEA